MQWMATGLSLIGAVINIFKSIWGFIIWILAAVFWVWWAASSSPIAVGFIITQMAFVSLNIYGIIRWSKEGEKG